MIAEKGTGSGGTPLGEESSRHEITERWSHFLSGFVHELKTPLASLSMLAELLEKELASTADEKRRQYTSQLGMLTHEIQSLVQDTGTLARLLGGRLRLAEGRVAIGELVEGALEAVRTRAWGGGVSVSGAMEADPDTVLRTDGAHLEDALAALVETGVALSDRQVTLRVTREGDEVRFVLEPDRRSDIDMLFDPFVSSASRRLKQRGARPLAPVLARELARTLGGDVDVQTGEGGTRLVLTVPMEASRG